MLHFILNASLISCFSRLVNSISNMSSGYTHSRASVVISAYTSTHYSRAFISMNSNSIHISTNTYYSLLFVGVYSMLLHVSCLLSSVSSMATSSGINKVVIFKLPLCLCQPLKLAIILSTLSKGKSFRAIMLSLNYSKSYLSSTTGSYLRARNRLTSSSCSSVI